MEYNKTKIFNAKSFNAIFFLKHAPKIISDFPVAKVRLRANWRELRSSTIGVTQRDFIYDYTAYYAIGIGNMKGASENSASYWLTVGTWEPMKCASFQCFLDSDQLCTT